MLAQNPKLRSRVLVAKLDADKHRELGEPFGIKGGWVEGCMTPRACILRTPDSYFAFCYHFRISNSQMVPTWQGCRPRGVSRGRAGRLRG